MPPGRTPYALFVLLVESATIPMTFIAGSMSTTRRRAWSFTSTLPLGSWRTAATEPMESVLVAAAAGSCRNTTLVDVADGGAPAAICAPAAPATVMEIMSACCALRKINCVIVRSEELAIAVSLRMVMLTVRGFQFAAHHRHHHQSRP